MHEPTYLQMPGVVTPFHFMIQFSQFYCSGQFYNVGTELFSLCSQTLQRHVCEAEMPLSMESFHE